MPKSCLLVFPHCERKRQNSPFQIGTFHFRFFFSSLPLRFNISYLPTFFPKQVYLYGVLNKNSVNRYWVAMALSHRKRPMQFVSSYSFEKVAVLGRIILLLPPGLHSWHALRLRSGCSGPPGYTMLYTCLPLVSTCLHLCPTCLLLTCMSRDVPDVPQQFACVFQKGTTSRESFDATKYRHFLKKGATFSIACTSWETRLENRRPGESSWNLDVFRGEHRWTGNLGFRPSNFRGVLWIFLGLPQEARG